jgi:hypothetical protein
MREVKCGLLPFERKSDIVVISTPSLLQGGEHRRKR